MLETEYRVEVEDKQFLECLSIQIEQTINSIINNAALHFPPLGRYNEQINLGDEVYFEIAYRSQSGRISFYGVVIGKHFFQDSSRNTLRISCEGLASRLEREAISQHFIDISKLRRKTISQHFKNITLEQLMQYILQGTGLTLSRDIPTVKLRSYLLDTDGLHAVEKLGSDMGLYISLDDYNTLTVRFFQDLPTAAVVNYSEHDVLVAVHREGNPNHQRYKWYNLIIFFNPDEHIVVCSGDCEGLLYPDYRYDIDTDNDMDTLKKIAESKYKILGLKDDVIELKPFTERPVEPGMMVSIDEQILGERLSCCVGEIHTEFSTQHHMAIQSLTLYRQA